MKNLALLILIALLFSCIDDTPITTTEVVFKGDLGFEVGSLKSFDPKTWEHFFNPERVTVHLSNKTSSNIELASSNSAAFFRDGTDPWYIPHGTYLATVTGGGWTSRIEGLSYYAWTIKDTIVVIDKNTDVITFNLDKTPGLIVRDQDSGIEVHFGHLILKWTGRYDSLNVCDFMYVVPTDYTGVYGEAEYKVDVKANHYVYFKAKKQSTFVTLPVLVGDTINY